MTIATLDEHVMVRCRICCERQPQSEFRLRRVNVARQRSSDCNRCHVAAERERRRQKTASRTRRSFESAATRMAAARSQREANALVDELVRRFGGVENVGALWMNTLANARTYSAAHFRLISGIIRLFQISDQANRHRRLSEDELQDILQDGIHDVLTHEPDTFANVLRELGWSVQPPAPARFQTTST